MMWNRTKGYIFTNKVHSQKGIMSTILGLLSLITLGTAVYFSYLHKGEPSVRYATAALLASVFMVTGLILGSLFLKRTGEVLAVPDSGDCDERAFLYYT